MREVGGKKVSKRKREEDFIKDKEEEEGMNGERRETDGLLRNRIVI